MNSNIKAAIILGSAIVLAVAIYVYFSPHQVCVRAQKANDNAEHAEMACVNLLSPS